jgi:hypothetical protein
VLEIIAADAATKPNPAATVRMDFEIDLKRFIDGSPEEGSKNLSTGHYSDMTKRRTFPQNHRVQSFDQRMNACFMVKQCLSHRGAMFVSLK